MPAPNGEQGRDWGNGASKVPEGSWTAECHQQVVASAPEFAEEQGFQRAGVAVVDAAQSRVRDNPVTGQAQAVAQVDVLTRGEFRVEPADGLKRLPLHREVAAANPGDLFLAIGTDAQPVVLPLHPVRVGIGKVGAPGCRDVAICEDCHCRADPGRTDLVVGVGKRDDASEGGARTAIAQRGNAVARGPQDDGAVLSGGGARPTRRPSRYRPRRFQSAREGSRWRECWPGSALAAARHF